VSRVAFRADEGPWGEGAGNGGQNCATRNRRFRNLARRLHVPLVGTEAQSFPAGAGDYFWFDGAFRTREQIFADFPLVLDRLKKEPMTHKELVQILNHLEYQESAQMMSNGGLARNLTEYEALVGDWRYLIEHRQKVATITPADVMRVAKQYFTRENRTVGFITKKAAALPGSE